MGLSDSVQKQPATDKHSWGYDLGPQESSPTPLQSKMSSSWLFSLRYLPKTFLLLAPVAAERNCSVRDGEQAVHLLGHCSCS